MGPVEELCKTEHGIQRCTYFVAHVQQESVLQLFRLLRLFGLLPEHLLGIDHLRLVAAQAEIVTDGSVFSRDRHHPECPKYAAPLFVVEECL